MDPDKNFNTSTNNTQQNAVSNMLSNRRAGMRVSNFSGPSVSENSIIVANNGAQTKTNKRFYLIAIILAVVIIVGAIVAIIMNSSNKSNDTLSYDKAGEIFSEEKIDNIKQFEVFYDSVVDGAQNLGNLLNREARKELVDGFDNYKKFYDEINGYSSVTKKDGETINLDGLKTKMSAMIETSGPIVAEYKNLYESFKKDSHNEIIILGLKKGEIQEKSGIISNKKMNDFLIVFLENITKQNELTTEYKSRCNTFRTDECEQIEAEFDSIGEKIMSKQVLSDYFKNGKDDVFFQDNRVIPDILDIKAALR